MSTFIERIMHKYVISSHVNGITIKTSQTNTHILEVLVGNIAEENNTHAFTNNENYTGTAPK